MTQWISSAKSEFDELVSIEMVAAWQGTIDSGLGIFAEAAVTGHVLAFSESISIEPNPPNVKPHLLWIKYLQETLEMVKMTRSGYTRSIISLLLNTFPCAIPGSSSNLISRDVSAAAARVELASLGLTVLYCGDIELGSVERSVLRNKIYSSVFDYFSSPAAMPIQSQLQLREDTVTLMRFYFKLHTEQRVMAAEVESGSFSDVLSDSGASAVARSNKDNFDRGSSKQSGTSGYVSSSKHKSTYPRSMKSQPGQKINERYSRL